MVAQVDEQHPAMVADAVAPAGQPHLLADVGLAQGAAGMGAITMHRAVPASDSVKLKGARKTHEGWALSRQSGPAGAAGICTVRRGRVSGVAMPPKSSRKKKTRPASVEMSTGEATTAALIAHGLDTVYALPGVHNDHLFDAFHRAGDALRVVHTRHEQGAAYMALGAALATGKPQAYAVVPGPGLLNSGAALLTAYGMNAPVLAIIGQIPHATIGRGLGQLHEIRDQAGIIARLVDHSAHIHAPAEAPEKVAKAIAAMRQGSKRNGRRGPAALECAIDVWGKRGPVTLIPPLPERAPRIDEDKVKAAAKLLGKAKRILIVVGGGALDASSEVTLLSDMLQAPVLAYRRGRGVLDGRSPFSVTLPLGRELWGEADAVLGIGTRLLNADGGLGRRQRFADRARRRRPRRAGAACTSRKSR